VIFSKVQEFLQNSVFSPTSAPFVLFALDTPLFSDFQQSGRGCTKQRFQPDISTFYRFCTGDTTFLEFSVKCASLYKTEVFSTTAARFVIFALGTPLFSDFQQSAWFVQNSVFSPISARFLIFALGTPLLRVFSKVHEFVQNSVFSSKSAGFVIFALGPRVCSRQRFQPDQITQPVQINQPVPMAQPDQMTQPVQLDQSYQVSHLVQMARPYQMTQPD